MKKGFIIFLAFKTIQSAFSQDFIISNQNQHDIWIGIDNPVSVLVNRVPVDSFYLSIDNGQIIHEKIGIERIKGSKSLYYARPKFLGKAIVSVIDLHNGDTIGQQEFRVLDLPDLLGFVGGKNFREIRNVELSVQSGIVALLDDRYFPGNLDLHFTITSYSVLVVHNENCTLFKYKGYLFPNDLKGRFLDLNRDDRVVFFNIKATSPDGVIWKVKPVELTII